MNERSVKNKIFGNQMQENGSFFEALH